MTRQSAAINYGYEVLIKGHLSHKRLSWFEGVTVVPLPEGTTLVTMTGNDQASLHALLNALSDLGVTVISIIPAGGPQETDDA
jgi:hypothetical protein